MRSLVIDVRFEGGRVRVKRATGVQDRRTLRDLRAMLRLLWRQPQHRELVRDIASNRRALLDVYHAWQGGRLEGLASAVHDRPLADVLPTWLDTRPASASHRHRLRQVFRQLCARVQGAPRLTDLPVLVEEYRIRCHEADTPRAFNLAKNGARALVRDVLGKRHPVLFAIADIPSLTERKHGASPLTIEQASAVRDRLPQHAAAAWWAMCLTGMGATEFWGEWEAMPDRVRILGTKRPGRRWGGEGRDVPLVVHPTRPGLSVQHFVRLLRPAGASPYQARKSFATWLEDAEIPRTRRRLYLGHGAKDVTDLYERREVTAFLAEDATRLKALLEKHREFALQIVATAPLVLSATAGLLAANSR